MSAQLSMKLRRSRRKRSPIVSSAVVSSTAGTTRHWKRMSKVLQRPNIIIAGLTTDICLFWAATGAQQRGYKVMVVADACGTMSTLGDKTTFDRLRSLGMTVSVTNQVVTELVNDFGTPDGQKAQQIMADEIISKLSALKRLSLPFPLREKRGITAP